MKAKRYYELEVLLDLDAFDFAGNYIVKYAVRCGYERPSIGHQIQPHATRPEG